MLRNCNYGILNGSHEYAAGNAWRPRSSHTRGRWLMLKAQDGAGESRQTGGTGSRFPWYFWTILGVWAIAAIWQSGGGGLSQELEQYLPYHLSSKPFFNKIYDSRMMEVGHQYVCRELSYAIDEMDCRFMAWSVHIGVPHFLSLSYFLCVFGISLLLWRFFVADLKLDRTVACTLLALYLTAPCVYLTTSCFRAAKIALTLALAILARQLWRGLRNNDSGYARWTLFAVVAFAATICDRQGFYFMLVTAVCLAVLCALRRTRAAVVALVASLAVVGLSTVYNHLIGPYLTFRLNGYWPDLTFQNLPWQVFRAAPGAYIWAGVGELLDTTRFMFGSFPSVLVLPFLAAAVFFIAKRHGRVWASIAGLLLLSLAAMNTLMTLRHPPLIWPDIRRVYYWLPETLLLAIIAGIALAARFPKGNIAVRSVLAAALIGNVIAIPGHLAVLAAGHPHPRILFDRPALDRPRSPTFNADLRRALATRKATPEIAADPVYRALTQ